MEGEWGFCVDVLLSDFREAWAALPLVLAEDLLTLGEVGLFVVWTVALEAPLPSVLAMETG